MLVCEGKRIVEMGNVRIRKLVAADADDIADIYAAIIRSPLDAGFKALIEKHAKSVDDICFVAELDQRVVGYIIGHILTIGISIEKTAWIATLGVDPDHMDQGLGERLTREILDFYKKMQIGRVYTPVRWDSTDLLSFFKNFGFNQSNFINLKKDL